MQMIGDHVKELFGGMEGNDEMVGDGDLYMDGWIGSLKTTSSLDYR